MEGTDSFEELSASALILEQAGVGNDVVIVTDPYHALRAAEIAEEVGLHPHVSPTQAASGVRRGIDRVEPVAVAIGRIMGYRRLASVA